MTQQNRRPNYKSRPRGVSITVYDLQGNPISPSVKNSLTMLVENIVKSYGIPSLAIDVSEG